MRDDPLNLSPGDVRDAPPDPNLGLAALAATPSGFDRSLFLDQARATFMATKQAVEARDLGPVKARLGEGVVSMLQAQVSQLLAQRVVHHFEGLSLDGMAIASADHGEQFDTIAVRFDAQAAQYAIDEVRHQFVFGDRHQQPFTEYWTFSRLAGVPAPTPTAPPTCPNCGAPIAAEAGPTCTYCGAALPSRLTFGWLVTAIQDPIDFQL